MRLNPSKAFFFRLLISGSMISLLSGCLLTREDQKEQEEKLVVRKELSTLQQSTADSSSKYQDLEDEVRKLNGRVEVFEAKFQQQNVKLDKAHSAGEAKAKENDQAYREEFSKIANQVAQIVEKVTALQSQLDELKKATQAKAEAESAKNLAAEKNPLANAEELFGKKKWRESVLSYERYRSQNPKGKSLAMATYKIGVSFQELGMIEDAQAFFEEVVSKFPKSKEAEKAEARLKKFKGK